MKNIVTMLLGLIAVGCTAETPPNKEFKMFDGSLKNYVIFSPMRGVLLKDGNPLPNVKIIRTLKWNGNDEGEKAEFITDEGGRFSIPAHDETLSLGMLNQFVGKADLEVEIEGGTDYLWTSNKFTPEMYAETDGPISELVCDLESEEIRIEVGQSTILTKCRWKDMSVGES